MTTTATVATQEQQSKRPWRMALWPIVGAGAALMATAYVARVDPNLNTGYPPCPLKAMTGLDCPGCGGLRCVHALTQGDVATALDQNLLAVVLVPLAAIWIAVTIVRRLRGNTQPMSVAMNPKLVNRAWIAIIAFALVFSIARNLPFVGFLPSGIG